MESAYLMLVYFSNKKTRNEKTRTKKIIIQYPSLMSFSSQASTIIT